MRGGRTPVHRLRPADRASLCARFACRGSTLPSQPSRYVQRGGWWSEPTPEFGCGEPYLEVCRPSPSTAALRLRHVRSLSPLAVEEFSSHRYQRWRDLGAAVLTTAVENIGSGSS